MSLQVGMRGCAETEVVHENTAAAVGSGAMEVFATPSMIALMEKAALELVQPELNPGEATVGTAIAVTHDAATPLGKTVIAEAVLTEIDRRRLEFEVLARVGDEIIGKGRHTRFIIDAEKFMKKVSGK